MTSQQAEKYNQTPQYIVNAAVNNVYGELGKLRALLLFSAFTPDEVIAQHAKLREAFSELDRIIPTNDREAGWTPK